jgi:hypothetical protein
VKSSSALIVICLLIIFLPVVVPAWIVLAFGMPIGVCLLFTAWVELS